MFVFVPYSAKMMETFFILKSFVLYNSAYLYSAIYVGICIMENGQRREGITCDKLKVKTT